MNWSPLTQGREVFAVPGKVDSPMSYGTHRLIKDGAKLVQDVDDIIEELGMQIEDSDVLRGAGADSSGLEAVGGAGAGAVPGLADEDKKVYEILSTDPCQIDVICSRTSISASKVSSILMMLEIKGFVKQLPGKQFVRAGSA